MSPFQKFCHGLFSGTCTFIVVYVNMGRVCCLKYSELDERLCHSHMATFPAKLLKLYIQVRCLISHCRQEGLQAENGFELASEPPLISTRDDSLHRAPTFSTGKQINRSMLIANAPRTMLRQPGCWLGGWGFV